MFTVSSPRTPSLTSLPCWARDPSLLNYGAYKVLQQRVQTLNKSQEDAAQWYDSSLTSMERARMILEGITNDYKHVWMADDLDEFVSNLNTILWPNVTYEYSGLIFSADAAGPAEHLDDYTGDCTFCRFRAYRICAVELLAAHLEDCKARGEGQRSDQKHIWNPATHQLEISVIDSLLPAHISKRSEYPVWIRQPLVLDNYLHRDIVAIIRQVDSSNEEPAWHTQITTRARANIILSRIQRLHNKRVIQAVERRRPMAALFGIFSARFALTLRTRLNAELNRRRRDEPSTWNQAHGVWAVARRALIDALQQCETAREPQNITHRLLNWVNRSVGRLGSADSES
ncbi:hypothetical protein F4861DRAFT_547044 [Xylaria intraflava]|nr:hypothetical protein F4861DRAFT_547044 [Xylaria intraflava]